MHLMPQCPETSHEVCYAEKKMHCFPISKYNERRRWPRCATSLTDNLPLQRPTPCCMVRLFLAPPRNPVRPKSTPVHPDVNARQTLCSIDTCASFCNDNNRLVHGKN